MRTTQRASKMGILPLLLLAAASTLWSQTPGQNVNMVSGTKWPGGDPFLQRQNEPSLAVSTRNPIHLLAGANDYRSVDIPNPNSSDERGDAWLGVFKSLDGGATWGSTLLPGYPQDQSAIGLASPLHGYSTAADPVVRAGTNGLFYYSGIAFNRGTNLGQIFVARFMDLNNLEGGDASQSLDPIRYIGVVPIDTGTSGQFLDKPWIAVDVPRGTATCTVQVPQGGTTVTQKIPAGNIYVVWSRFTGSTSTKIMFSKSVDCGATWSTPSKLSESNSVNQGTTMAIDPGTGNIYVAWRRFLTSSQPDAIVGVVSTNFGKSFSKSLDIASLPAFDPNNLTAPSFFDQESSGASFRTHSFPTIGVDGFGTVYLAWSQRGFGLSANLTPTADARIVMTTSPNGSNWSKPFPIDNGPLMEGGLPLLSDSGQTLNRGHQVMPQITLAGGKLFVLYYDLREDHTISRYSPNSPFSPAPGTGNFYQEDRVAKGELPSSPDQVFTPFLSDQGLTARRHTIDLVIAQAVTGASPLVFSTARVSRYDFGLRNDSNDIPGYLQQLQVDPPNFKLFAQGTLAFLGDYIDLAGLPFLPSSTAPGGWRFNTLPSDPNVVYASWTSNQDVRPPADGDWTHYTPVGGGGPSVTGSGTTPSCISGQEGMRNQNIYSSRITQGLLVSVPQNSKPLSTTLQRSFILLAQNSTNLDKTFRLTITNQPPGGRASFNPVPNQPIPSPLPALTSSDTGFDVKIAAHAGIARPIFALSSSPTASITVTVAEITGLGGTLVSNGLTGYAVLNADPLAPALINPDGNTAGDISKIEIYNPNISNPNISNPNISNPNISNPNISNPNISNPNISNPNISNPDIANLNVSDPNISNPNISNPNISNPNISNPNISNSPISDATYTVSNSGNTTASYGVKLVGNSPAGTNLQLVVTKGYQTPVGLGCQLMQQTQIIPVANVDTAVTNDLATTNLADPTLTNPEIGNATLTLAPGESALVTVRSPVDTTTMQTIPTILAPVVTAQAANTDSNTPKFAMPPLITLGTLPNGIVGVPYQATLQATGGTAPYTWSIQLGSLPLGLALDSTTGAVSGTPTSAGVATFTVQAVDASSPPRSATRAVTLTVNKGGTVTTITSVTPNPSLIGQAVTVSFSVTVLPPGSGTPTPGGTVTISDGAGASCTATLPLTSCSLNPTVIGAGNMTATYSGDGNYTGSSGLAAFKVKANTTTMIVSISPNPVVVGQPTTVTFSVTVVAPGTGTPTGTVTASDGAGASCTATLPATSCSLTSTAIGSHTLTATYSGDSNFAGSSGTSTVQLTVTYAFTGFLSPLSVAGTFSSPTYSGTANLGSAVPIKWQLRDGNGNYVSSLSSLNSMQAIFNTACAGVPTGQIYVLYAPTLGATGNSTFRYDTTNNQFIFNWDTSNVTPAGCYTIVVQLSDQSPLKATTIQLH
ncbi:MAG: Ig-like domain repeat protein [Acidobacteriia bacterium]|nr:Ig-like domain repeat protein [Terriglobia bacterium]